MNLRLSVTCIIILFFGLNILPIAGCSSVEKPESLQNLSSIKSIGLSLITIQVAREIGLNNWCKSDIDFKINYESDEIAAIYYGIDGEWMLYNKTFTVSTDGSHILEWYAVDCDGNQSEVMGPFSFNIDQTPPEIFLSYEIFGYNPNKGWEIQYTATATDDTSGMDRVEFYVNDDLQDIVYGPGPYYQWNYWYQPTEEYLVVKALGYDKAGNSEYDAILYPSNTMLEIGYTQTTLPSLIQSNLQSLFVPDVDISEKLIQDLSTLGINDLSYIIIIHNRRLGNNDWCVDNVTLSFIPDPDRISEVYYKLNNGDWILYSEPVNISEDGVHNFSWYVVDTLGNTSTPDSLNFKIDMTPPEINLRKERLSIDEIKFIADVNDEMSGINKVKFFVDDYLEFTDYDFPYEWIWTGWRNEKVKATVYDKAGNKDSDTKSTFFNTNQNNQNINLRLSSSSFFFPMLERLLNLLIN